VSGFVSARFGGNLTKSGRDGGPGRGRGTWQMKGRNAVHGRRRLLAAFVIIVDDERGRRN